MISAVNLIKEHIESLGFEIRHHVPSMQLQQENESVFAISYETPIVEVDNCNRSIYTFICTIDAVAPQRTENDDWFIDVHTKLEQMAQLCMSLTANGSYQNIMAITRYEFKVLGIDGAMRSAYQLRLNVICQ